MSKLYKNEQSGRSMVEMLGVLAIIGVLSVAGIAGYSKAMAKFKQSKMMDQVSMTVANIRTLFSGQRSYDGLTTTEAAVDMGVIPDEMIERNGQSETGNIVNAFGGLVGIIVVDSVNGAKNGAFQISFAGLSRETCVAMATADWGSGASSGLEGMKAISDAPIADVIGERNDLDGISELPIPIATATGYCSCGTATTCGVIWQYN